MGVGIGKGEGFYELLKKWMTAEKRFAFVITFVLGIIINFELLVSQVGNGDTVWNGMRQGGMEVERTSGRWFLEYIALLRAKVVNPVWILFLCFILISIGIVLLVDIFELRNYPVITCFAILILASPYINTAQVIFYTSDGYILSFLLAIMAAWLIIKFRMYPFYILSVFAMTLSLALYQSNICITGILVIFYLLLRLQESVLDKKFIIKSVNALACGILGIVGYFMSLKISMMLRGYSLSSYKGMNQMGRLSRQQILGGIVGWQNYIRELYFVKNGFSESAFANFQDIGIGINFIIAIALFIMLISYVYKKEKKWIICYSILLVILIMMWGVIVFMAPMAPLNVLISSQMPFMYIFFMIMLKKATEKGNSIKKKVLKGIGGICVGIICYFYVFSSMQLYFGMRWSQQRTYAMLNRIVDRVEQVDGWYSGIPLAIIGDIYNKESFPVNRLNIRGMGMTFMWPGSVGTMFCYPQYLRTYLGVDYSGCSREFYYNLIDNISFKEMPCYPADESVQILDGVVIVKLSDPAREE